MAMTIEESSHRSKHHLSGCRMDWHSHFGHPIADGKLTYGAIQLSSVALVDKLLAVCLNTWKQWRTRKMCQSTEFTVHEATRLAGLAFMFSSSILLQILACALYNNWWPMLSALMYVVVPMPCLFFGGGSTQFLISRDGGGWMDAAKFLTGASAVGSIAIPIILRHADLIQTGAMFIEFVSFFIFVCTVMCYHRASLDDEW
ncbi:hypothetical protein KY290_035765 [Solanum tuberosum]|uniref:Vacuolar protein sorting-associated protein 55 homolog n=4 Tax=Solanum TaxID=4107 RepID=A0ABQ7TUF7_SOLTU|nr:hypothetical protein KY290_035765 [Solanum tuberosum]